VRVINLIAPAGEPDDEPQPLHGLVGHSPAMRRVVDQISRLAACSAPVLIVGETGTGKELIARAMHECGPRRARPFVAINCAALQRELVESELFGHRRGAFSGALADHRGLLRAGAGGTVLLDEITEMSPLLQAKLLRVLQERSVRPVGALNEVPLDVRFIASCNRDLAASLRDGLLRADLYYRLSVSVIAVAPLAERAADIPLLVAHHLRVLNRRYADNAGDWRDISPEAIEALAGYAWPGNVRELFNVLEGAYIACTGRLIRPADLALPPAPERVHAAAITDRPAAAGSTCAQQERALIEHMLRATGGNKTLAARRLGISRKRLYARLARYSR
jgi:transcriptional regulator with PAS, ATPase and Fis domain